MAVSIKKLVKINKTQKTQLTQKAQRGYLGFMGYLGLLGFLKNPLGFTNTAGSTPRPCRRGPIGAPGDRGPATGIPTAPTRAPGRASLLVITPPRTGGGRGA